MAEGYVRAIQWILHYYYNGVPSWSWFYPQHYAPYLSDVKNFSDMRMEFDKATPFMPFEQLMAVLPAASKNLLPLPFQSLMVNEDSPIKDFYPEEFEADLNEKMQEWEAVVLIPFIDEKRLLDAMRPLHDKLTDKEKQRNKHGPHHLCTYSKESLGKFPTSLPGHFPNIAANHANCTDLDKDTFRISPDTIVKGLCPQIQLDVYYPGFPTFKHIPHTAIEDIAREYIGQTVFTNWPHLSEARVIAVANNEYQFSLVEGEQGQRGTQTRKEALDRDMVNVWYREVNSITERYHDRLGVDVGTTSILLYACPLAGRRYVCGRDGNVSLEKEWLSRPVPFAIQATVKDIAVSSVSFQQYETLSELFPVHSSVFMLGTPHYGCMGEVLDYLPENNGGGRIRVSFTILPEPDLSRLINMERQQNTSSYMPGYIVARKLGISGYMVSRITGTIFVTRGSKQLASKSKMNVGLNLKFNKKNLQVPGYTRKDDGNSWVYSDKVCQILAEYTQRFPCFFDYISKNLKEESYYEEEIFEGTE
ncbi:5'-3' exoribonuclease 1 [Lamellibrachia satsuma]|nr:5'-3' exoribonuclease 1 [Lamellibrachia satsuma]